MSHHGLRFIIPLLLASFYGISSALGSDDSVVKGWIAQPILAADQPQAEIERYLDAKIPRLPAFASREEWEQAATKIREEMLAKVIYRGRAADWRDAPLKVDWQEVLHGGDGYRIKKLRYEALPGLWIPALLYEPLDTPSGPRAVALNVNGHDQKGKAAVYKQLRCINQAKRGMLVLNVEWLGMGQLNGKGYNHGRMNQLDLCGTCGLAPFYLAMKRGLDVILSHPQADPSRVAVAGLSGGGWQTIFISALDTRVTLTNPVAGYSSLLTRVHNHSDLGDSEQTPNDMATVGDYSHLTAMLAPRAALLTFNVKDDCCFASGHALPPLLEAATPIYKLYGQEARLRSHVNLDPGTHNFERDNREAFYRIMVDQFFAGQPDVSGTEIESESEVKTAEQLRVSLPANNADFHTLAYELAKSLPRDAELPKQPADVSAWQARKRQLLQATLHTHEMPVVAEHVQEESQAGLTATRFRLHLADTWTVPAVLISPEKSTGTMIVVGDNGRAGMEVVTQSHLQAGRRVILVDPFYIGESKIKNRAYLWALFVQAVGDRPAGVQASQLLAIARWLKQRHPGEPIGLEAHGQRLSLAALGAAALEPTVVDSVRLHGSLPTLRDVISEDYGYDSNPELFAFGLLEHFDVQTIAALIAPREVQFVSATDRHRAELAGLVAWYQRCGKDFDPTK